jgi:hypothetical protein
MTAIRKGWPAFSRLRRWDWRVWCMLEVHPKDKASDDTDGDREGDIEKFAFVHTCFR